MCPVHSAFAMWPERSVYHPHSSPTCFDVSKVFRCTSTSFNCGWLGPSLSCLMPTISRHWHTSSVSRATVTLPWRSELRSVAHHPNSVVRQDARLAPACSPDAAEAGCVERDGHDDPAPFNPAQQPPQMKPAGSSMATTMGRFR
jgi:hypothetical protein